MFPRHLVGSVLRSFTPALVAGCGLGFITPAIAATAVVTYNIDNHDHLATVKDATGKILLTRRVSTPTLKAIIAKSPDAAKSASRGLSLTLEDQNGLRLWSTAVLVPPQLHSAHSMQLSAQSSSKVRGTRVEFTFSTDAAPAPDQPAGASLVCVIGADGRLVSMNAADTSGKQYNMTTGPNGFSLTGPDGDTGGVDMTLAGNKLGGTMEINGTKVPLVTVERDGKHYLSFPWNGHQVFVQDGCTLTVNGDGDLIVNAPSAGK